MDKYFLFGGLAIATVGATKDLRGRTIPNWLSYSGILSGLTFRVAMAAWPALKSGFLGLLIGGGFFYLLFLAGGMGGGDVHDELEADQGTYPGPIRGRRAVLHARAPAAIRPRVVCAPGRGA